ncbi:U3 small nucleolar RNA-associated protein 11 [Metschnikowia bicuspidata var. bicuspidata NRRL YB-4993]|uniref:U3 small nucleolar RNA-associated protein 11 n=1 Tax=Metschnikowia bicuspidata var. bicuspidata NRRL YB-4993 TaxID=869754 RepID=A0A1A0GZ09_9ASCO|nr:U3 small nucleolar RNA-associated protein 11 [Metschnikowia bicuspidata var. bicuspidata NRRL YB-4993]OBA16963.1 U3 small nucleolar RNA-associated protein 11 [Metschnikowia bicuspidata var. bicuspidata NRRL YB-4993]
MAKLVHNVQKKQHKERSQTSDRARFGLLEKKKDYKLRANDHHRKQAALKVLKQKAAQYNPDEYYHAMTKKRTDQHGVLVRDRGNENLSTGQMKLLKSQDVNYVRTMRLNESQKADKLRKSLDFQAQGKHTVFVDTEHDAELFDAARFFNTDESMLERRENRMRVDQLETNEKVLRQDLDADERADLEKEKLRRFKLLKERMTREKQLREVEQKLEITRELMKNGNRKKLVDDDGNVVFKWKNERKK